MPKEPLGITFIIPDGHEATFTDSMGNAQRALGVSGLAGDDN